MSELKEEVLLNYIIKFDLNSWCVCPLYHERCLSSGECNSIHNSELMSCGLTRILPPYQKEEVSQSILLNSPRYSFFATEINHICAKKTRDNLRERRSGINTNGSSMLHDESSSKDGKNCSKNIERPAGMSDDEMEDTDSKSPLRDFIDMDQHSSTSEDEQLGIN